MDRKYQSEIKYRNEIKYLCSEQDLRLIESRIRTICKRDPHAGETGVYTIRSVYFDDYDNRCFYENEDGVDPREKFRIRIYNGDTSHIHMECKRKESGKNHKDSCILTKEQCSRILKGDFSLEDMKATEHTVEEQKLLSKFFLQYRTRLLRAKVIVAYERTPYIYPMGNVRITFDRNIAGSPRTQDFLEETPDFRPVMPPGRHILEVKYDELIPDYLYNALQLGHLRQTAYSKYYVCRRFVTAQLSRL